MTALWSLLLVGLRHQAPGQAASHVERPFERDIATIRAIGARGDVTIFGVPPLPRNTHDDHPKSFQLFFRASRADPTRRKWDMTMAQQHGGAGHQH